MTFDEIKSFLATATPEQLAQLQNAFWDREIELDSESGAIERALQEKAPDTDEQ